MCFLGTCMYTEALLFCSPGRLRRFVAQLSAVSKWIAKVECWLSIVRCLVVRDFKQLGRPFCRLDLAMVRGIVRRKVKDELPLVLCCQACRFGVLLEPRVAQIEWSECKAVWGLYNRVILAVQVNFRTKNTQRRELLIIHHQLFAWKLTWSDHGIGIAGKRHEWCNLGSHARKYCLWSVRQRMYNFCTGRPSPSKKQRLTSLSIERMIFN